MSKIKISSPIVIIITQVITLILVGYNARILMPQLNYWKDRCSSVQQELTTKTSEFQASLGFFIKKLEVLEKENAVLKENNTQLTKKLEDIQSVASTDEKGKLHDELAEVKQSLEALSGKLQNQTVNIAEVKTGLKTAESYFAPSTPSILNNLSGEIIYNDGKTEEFNWMGAEFNMGTWYDYIPYSTNIEDKRTYYGPMNRSISFKDIARIDFLNLTESEREKDPESNWPMKARITFKDDKVWDSVYLSTYVWKYKTTYSEGLIISTVALWPKADGYRNIKSIVFSKR